MQANCGLYLWYVFCCIKDIIQLSGLVTNHSYTSERIICVSSASYWAMCLWVLYAKNCLSGAQYMYNSLAEQYMYDWAAPWLSFLSESILFWVEENYTVLDTEWSSFHIYEGSGVLCKQTPCMFSLLSFVIHLACWWNTLQLVETLLWYTLIEVIFGLLQKLLWTNANAHLLPAPKL
jgi:hypothetical protein